MPSFHTVIRNARTLRVDLNRPAFLADGESGASFSFVLRRCQAGEVFRVLTEQAGRALLAEGSH